MRPRAANGSARPVVRVPILRRDADKTGKWRATGSPVPRLFPYPARGIRGILRVGHGAVTLLPVLLRGRAATTRAMCVSANGLGMVLGLIGFSYHEYRRTHGR